jgi:polyisoprenoid-binding protein YceI
MIKRAVLFCFSAFLLHAAEMQVVFSPSDTHILYTLDSVLHTVKGTFRFKSGSIRFDSAGSKASGLLKADATSGQSGDHARDSRMHKEIIQSAKYPEITFAPDSIDGAVKLEGDSTVQVHGVFGIHGSEHEITMPAQVHVTNGDVSLRTSFSIPYIQWGMKNPSTFVLRVSSTVKIDIQAAGKLAGAPQP